MKSFLLCIMWTLVFTALKLNSTNDLALFSITDSLRQGCAFFAHFAVAEVVVSVLLRVFCG